MTKTHTFLTNRNVGQNNTQQLDSLRFCTQIPELHWRLSLNASKPLRFLSQPSLSAQTPQIEWGADSPLNLGGGPQKTQGVLDPPPPNFRGVNLRPLKLGGFGHTGWSRRKRS